MPMRLRSFRPNLLKIRQERAKFTFRCVVLQTLEVIRDIGYSRPLWEPYALLFPHHPDYPSLALVGKEEIQPYPKHHGNAQ